MCGLWVWCCRSSATNRIIAAKDHASVQVRQTRAAHDAQTGDQQRDAAPLLCSIAAACIGYSQTASGQEQHARRPDEPAATRRMPRRAATIDRLLWTDRLSPSSPGCSFVFPVCASL